VFGCHIHVLTDKININILQVQVFKTINHVKVLASQPHFNDLQLGVNPDDGYKTGHRNGIL
jgi:hypothetical protein